MLKCIVYGTCCVKDVGCNDYIVCPSLVALFLRVFLDVQSLKIKLWVALEIGPGLFEKDCEISV